MSANQRGWFIKRLMELHPDHSNRSIAAMVGVSHVTVQAIRSEDSTGQIDQFKTRIGMDGKSRPAYHNPPEAKPDVTTSVVDLMTSDDRDARHLMKSRGGTNWFQTATHASEGHVLF
jgi:hypothetical protein